MLLVESEMFVVVALNSVSVALICGGLIVESRVGAALSQFAVAVCCRGGISTSLSSL